MQIKYPTHTKHFQIPGKLFVIEEIRDLDEAIDLLCNKLSPDEQRDPFAEDLCPYFGILWPAARALGTFLSENPGIVRGKRILELGCGLGLPSLVASHFGGDVLATDFHPDVEDYFLRNCRHSSIRASYKRLNWREDLGEGEKFDVVMGSDVLYESKHPGEVARGLLKFVKPNGKILLSDPGRNYLQPFIAAMRELKHQESMSTIQLEGKDVFILKYLIECTE
jgi:predicted nicotinamide N-methyase